MSIEIQINTYNKEGSYSGGSGFNIIVTEENPWDPLSKVFKVYKHAIQYTASGGYKQSEYNISIYTKSSIYSKFKYKRSSEKVQGVEIYFGFTYNIEREDPLIFGFIYGNKTYYYTYGHLKSKCPSSSCYDGLINQSDLITRLLEEIGSSVKRPQKYVINLNQKPDGTTSYMYPSSGHKKGLIQLKKGDSGVVGLDKYVHTINAEVDGFYVSYNRNSIYFETTARSGILLGTVTVYFEKTGSKKPVLFLLEFRGKLAKYEYTYFDFVTELKAKGSKAKKISDLIDAKSLNLLSRLKDERERLREAITFVNQDGPKNENISTKGPDNVGEGKFKKLILTPNTNDAEGGSSVGPWEVRNGKLIGHESGKKIGPESVLRDITTSRVTDSNSKKYKTITVFYALTGDGGKNHKALLVEFDPGSSGTKTYIKRTNKEGDNWEEAGTDISSNGGNVDEGVLTSIGKAAGIIEGSNIAATVGGSIAGVVGVGVGAGYAVYKNFTAVSGLIGRIAGK